MKGRLALTLGGMAAAAFSSALTANFDSYSEGYFADTITDNGIRFYGVRRWQSDPNTNFTIEAANSGDLGGNFTAPNTLGFGGYVPGSGEAFGSVGELFFTADQLSRSVDLDIWTLPLNMGGNTVTLTGYRNGSIVNEDSFTQPNFDLIHHYRLSLPTDDYDTFRLWSSGPSVSGDSFMLLDNVNVVVPEPATLAAMGLGLALLIRRRK